MEFLKQTHLFIEIGQSSLKAAWEDHCLELPLERARDGSLTAASRDRIKGKLRALMTDQRRLAAPIAYCAIGARGVSLRRMTLPPTKPENLRQLLSLQIENEFPIPIDDLSWGYRTIGSNKSEGASDVIVVAVRKTLIEDYSTLLSEAGLTPVFTLGVLAASELCRDTSGFLTLLDIGRQHSELLSFENGRPRSIRSLSASGGGVTRKLAEELELNSDEANELKHQFDPDNSSPAKHYQVVAEALGKHETQLAAAIAGLGPCDQLLLTGGGSQIRGLAARLQSALGNGADCELLHTPTGNGGSAAIAGMRRMVETEEAGNLLEIGAPVKTGARNRANITLPWKWIGVAAALLCCLFATRYLEAYLNHSKLEAQLAEFNKGKKSLPGIDRELRFLQHVQDNQPPYLAALALLSDSAARGTKIQSVNMNRRGEISFRASMASGDQVTGMRKKLLESGMFAGIVLEEQSPVRVGQRKVNVRIRANWKTDRRIKSKALKKIDTDPLPKKTTSRGGPSPRISPSRVRPSSSRPASSSQPMPTMPPGARPIPTTIPVQR